MDGVKDKTGSHAMASIKSHLFSLAIYITATVSGFVLLLYPFFSAEGSQNTGFGSLRAGQMPMMMILLLALCLLVLLFEAQGPMVNTKLLAVLGILVAINSALRFIETALPGPGGFTPIFFLIILVGYVFGGRVGFLMGALTLLVSALITGGVGPWLPAQMFTAGWVGMSTPILMPLVKIFRHKQSGWGSSSLNPEIILLASYGLVWGFLYGAIMNLWQWPFIVGPQNQAFVAGSGWLTTLQHYLAFYLVTSLVWDAIAALGNVILILALGAPALRALRRFKQRFEFSYRLSASAKAVTVVKDRIK
jgi:energy-coupling factor transport system substrate-specific component